MAWQSRAVERLRGFPSPDVLLRMLLLHVARGYTLRETVVRAQLANWADISDVALLKRLRNSEEGLRLLSIELLRENVAYRLEEAISRTIRIVDGTIVREPDKTRSQWRILYSIRRPSLVCDFFKVTATIGEGSGESFHRLPVGPHELILADARYCSIAGLSMFGNMVLMCWFASTLRASWRTLHTTDVSPSFRDHALCPEWGSSAHGGLSAWSRFGVCGPVMWSSKERPRDSTGASVLAAQIEFATYVIVFTTRSVGSTADVLRSYRMRWQIELVTLGAGDHVVLRVNSVSRFTRSSKLSSRTSPCSKRSIRGIRLHKLLRKSRATDYFNWRNGVPGEHRSKDRPIGTCCPSEPASMPSRGLRPRP